jgi:putative transposase
MQLLHHKNMKSTNMLQRLNQEIKRHTRAVRMFLNTGVSCQILIAFQIDGKHSVAFL